MWESPAHCRPLFPGVGPGLWMGKAEHIHLCVHSCSAKTTMWPAHLNFPSVIDYIWNCELNQSISLLGRFSWGCQLGRKTRAKNDLSFLLIVDTTLKLPSPSVPLYVRPCMYMEARDRYQMISSIGFYLLFFWDKVFNWTSFTSSFWLDGGQR